MEQATGESWLADRNDLWCLSLATGDWRETRQVPAAYRRLEQLRVRPLLQATSFALAVFSHKKTPLQSSEVFLERFEN